IPDAVVVLVQSHVTTLKSQRPEASPILILSTHGAAGGHANLGLAVAAVVDMQVHDILLRAIIEDDFRALDHTVGAQIARTLPGKEGAHKVPVDEVGGGVAANGLEGGAL